MVAVTAGSRTLDLQRIAEATTGWRYAGGKRDLRLDLLRGVAAVAMIIDHIGGTRSWLYPLTGGNVFFVSGAESFVLIAGLTMGIVYGRIIATSGIATAVRKALRRGLVLYGVTVGLTLSFAAASVLAGAPWRPDMPAAALPGWLWSIVTLQRTYYLVDIMLMYSLLMCAAVPVLFGLARGRTLLVLAGTWGLWGFWQIAPAYAHVPWRIENNVMFHFAAWQVIFVNGVVVGYHARAIQRAVGGLWPARITAVTGAIALLLIVLYQTQARPGGLLAEGTYLGWQFITGKDDASPARLLALATFFAFGYGLCTLFWTPLRRLGGWLLMPLGQHALLAYALHLYVLALWHVVWPTWGVERDARTTATIQLAGLVLVWTAVVAWLALEAYRARAAEPAGAPAAEPTLITPIAAAEAPPVPARRAA